MAPDRDVSIFVLAHAPRNDEFFGAVGMLDDPKLVRHLVVEALMGLGPDFDGGGQGRVPLRYISSMAL